MTISQKIIWTALPNGIDGAGLHLSVFVAPQLTATVPVGANFATLSQFPDFVSWPTSIMSAPSGPIRFMVTLNDHFHTYQQPATIVTSLPAALTNINVANAWSLLFDPTTTQVEPFFFQDYSLSTIETFSARSVADFVASVYGSIGTNSPTDPLLLTASRETQFRSMAAGDAASQDVIDALAELGTVSTRGTTIGTNATSFKVSPHISVTPVSDFANLHNFHSPLGPPNRANTNLPTTPTLDFHQGLTALNNYPAILRMFHLVFDVVVPVPAGLAAGSINVKVTPMWTPKSTLGTYNVSPWTVASYSSKKFQAQPQGPDYGNGMLDLSDDSRFSVTDLDTDLAGDRLISLGQNITSVQASQATRALSRYGNQPAGQTAVTVPALRSAGPQVIWDGYASADGAGFSGLLSGQAALASQLSTWLTSSVDTNLPVIYAEQLIRGFRVDVYTASEAAPTWRSLNGRNGTYTFGPSSHAPITFSLVDEGILSPSASQRAVAGVVSLGFTRLQVHESIIRWNGWGLSAQRPGRQLSRYTNDTEDNPQNQVPAPVAGGPTPPQLSAYFSALSLPPELRFPKLRYGNQYQFRARAVDLAGNSVPLSSTDNSTATPLFTHYRYEPVRPPVLAGTAPFVPGEGTHFLVLLDDQTSPDPGTNGRWLFPPRTSIAEAEEHGMLDGFSFGSAPDPSAAPAGDAETYQYLTTLDTNNLSTMTAVPYDVSASPTLIGTYDHGNQSVPYFTGTPMPWTNYLSDPLSAGPAFDYLPGLRGPITNTWRGTWPSAQPVLLRLGSGAATGTTIVEATDVTPATLAVTLPPAESAVIRVSSALSDNALSKLGVWQWFGPSGDPSLVDLANSGQIWLLTPFQVVRMVHAVRLPLSRPAFQSPQTTRTIGGTSVSLDDPQFSVDDKSTGHLDVLATWTDNYDDPTDSTSNPAASPSTSKSRSQITTSGHAFRLTVPEPNPNGPEDRPLTIVEPSNPFAVAGLEGTSHHNQTATHHIGDTKHHVVHYSAIATSRFAEMFATTETHSVKVGTPLTLSTPALGINGASVAAKISNTTLEAGYDFSVDESARTFTLLAVSGRVAGATVTVDITYEPTVTVAGPSTPVHVLSSAPPKAPVISEIVPAWQITQPTGTLKTGGIAVSRTGGFLRVYLERPWFSSGDGELLGVVTTVTNQNDVTLTFPTVTQQKFVTMMGIDPINYNESSVSPWPVVPTKFVNLANVPPVPYRAPYAHPPQVNLAEDSDNNYMVWPYEVHYDSVTQRWYADVAPRPGLTEEEYIAPPGYFIRLALVRFQPYSTPTFGSSPVGPLEVSPVVLATFAQPVPDRSVMVVPNGADPHGTSVLVTVKGPAYHGWRTPESLGGQDAIQYDADNPWSPQNPATYGVDFSATLGKRSTSTMVVEVQVQNGAMNKMGLSGDLAWQTIGAPTELLATFSNYVDVTWGAVVGAQQRGAVKLPYPASSPTKMRLRISEIDYYEGASAPTVVDTSLRRPFVSIIPIN